MIQDSNRKIVDGSNSLLKETRTAEESLKMAKFLAIKKSKGIFERKVKAWNVNELKETSSEQ